METPTATYSSGRPEHKQGWKPRTRGPAPSVYLLKPGFQNLLRPAARILADLRLGLTANQVTVFAAALSVAYGLVLASTQTRGLYLLLPALLFLRMALNAMDGMMARESGRQSPLGTYLNELGDVLSDAFLYLPFVYLPEFDSRWMVAVLVLAATSEMAATVGVMTGASRRYDGPLGKSDRAVVFGALGLWLGLGWDLAPWASYLFPRLMTLLLALTVINRVRNGLAETNASSAKRGNQWLT